MAAAQAWPAGWELVHHARIDSTNLEARRLIEAGSAPPAPFVVWADEQLAGRGRLGRQWASPPGNLYSSLVIAPRCSAARAAELGFVAALAMRDAARAFLPDTVPVSLKWPNDVLVDGGKISGVLLEGAGVAGDGPAFVIAGIGLNVAHAPDVGEARFPPRALAAFVSPPPPGEVLLALVAGFDAWLARWRDEGFAPLRAAWLAGCGHVGTEIEVRLGPETLTGRFSGLAEDGTLILETAAGAQRISAGDVYPRLAGG
jgi:BirA family biotin operon repressor/biotin-[acetyl-CoA-carboxylase] ligase